MSAFIIGFILLLPFTATPLGNQLAADYPFPCAWLGWASRAFLDGGDLPYVMGAIFGAVLYAIFRRMGRTPELLTELGQAWRRHREHLS